MAKVKLVGGLALLYTVPFALTFFVVTTWVQSRRGQSPAASASPSPSAKQQVTVLGAQFSHPSSWKLAGMNTLIDSGKIAPLTSKDEGGEFMLIRPEEASAVRELETIADANRKNTDISKSEATLDTFFAVLDRVKVIISGSEGLPLETAKIQSQYTCTEEGAVDPMMTTPDSSRITNYNTAAGEVIVVRPHKKCTGHFKSLSVLAGGKVSAEGEPVTVNFTFLGVTALNELDTEYRRVIDSIIPAS